MRGLIECGQNSEIPKTNRFESSKDLKQTLEDYLRIYDHHIPQKMLGHITPVAALQNWKDKQPELFRKRIYNHPGLDILALD